MNKHYEKGFSVIEILVVIAIMALLAGITLTAFSTKLRSVSLEKESEIALSYITKARNQTVASQDNSSFGIRVSSTTLDFFKGTSFSSGSEIVSYRFVDAQATANLTGGGSELYFNRISGAPSKTGTITLTSRKNASSTKTILIQATGLAEVQ